MKTLIVLLLAAAAFHVGAVLMAVAFLVGNRGFGAGDLGALCFWTLVMTGPVLALGAGHARGAPPGRWLAAHGVVLAGVGIGFLATLGVRAMLGPWFGAFSFPVLYCWVVGAVAACGVLTAGFRCRAAGAAP